MTDATAKFVASLKRTTWWLLIVLAIMASLAAHFDSLATSETSHYYMYAAAAGTGVIAILAIMATISIGLLAFEKKAEQIASQEQSALDLALSVEKFAQQCDIMDIARKRMVKSLRQEGD